MKELTWASDQQREFVESGPAPTLFAGGYGSGKSVAIVLKMLMLLDRYHGSRGVIVRKQYSQLLKTVMATLFQWLPKDRIKRFSEQQGIVELYNGSVLYLMHLNDSASINVLRGLEVSFCAFDQLEEIEEDVFDLMHTRVGRWSGASRVGGWPLGWKWKTANGQPLPPPYLFASSNAPGYESFVFRRWGPSPEREQWEQLGYKVITAPSWSNAFLGAATLEVLQQKGDDFVKRFVDFSSWGATEGMIHEVSNLSLVSATPELIELIKNSYRKWRVLDHGESAPTACGWFASDREGNVFAYKEYYLPGELVSLHRKNITAMSKGERYDGNFADPSIFSKNRGRTATHGPTHAVSDEYKDVDILPLETALFWTPADNNEMGTRNRINEYLAVDLERIHPITKQKGAPRLFFILKSASYPEGVSEILKETRAQKRVKIQEGVYSDERDPEVVDHGYDTLRYFLASRPAVARAPKTNKYDPATWQGYANLSKRSKRLRESGGQKSDPTQY